MSVESAVLPSWARTDSTKNITFSPPSPVYISLSTTRSGTTQVLHFYTNWIKCSSCPLGHSSPTVQGTACHGQIHWVFQTQLGSKFGQASTARCHFFGTIHPFLLGDGLSRTHSKTEDNSWKLRPPVLWTQCKLCPFGNDFERALCSDNYTLEHLLGHVTSTWCCWQPAI